MTSPPITPGDSPQWIGHVLDGRYKIRELLGEGGMGAVYTAEHLSLRKQVAELKHGTAKTYSSDEVFERLGLPGCVGRPLLLRDIAYRDGEGEPTRQSYRPVPSSFMVRPAAMLLQFAPLSVLICSSTVGVSTPSGFTRRISIPARRAPLLVRLVRAISIWP